MKRILVLILSLIPSILVHSEDISREVVELYFPSLIGAPYGETAEIHVYAKDGRLQLEYVNRQSYNAYEFQDCAAYSIPKGARLYLKLANDDIITLTCEDKKDIKKGYVRGINGTYQGYENCSFFPLDENTIDKLRNFEIVKIRAELKKGIYDGSLKYSENSKPNKSDFNSAYQYVIERVQKAEKESSRQSELKENPLLDF